MYLILITNRSRTNKLIEVFFCSQPIAIGLRPVTREVVIYMFNVGVLVAIVWDSQVDWYEAVILGVLYVLYFVLMFNSMRLFRLYDRIVARYTKNSSTSDTGKYYITYVNEIFTYK